MSTTGSRKLSAAACRRRRSSEKRSVLSFEANITETSPSQLLVIDEPVVVEIEEKCKPKLQDEITLLFFDSMLNVIVDEWVVTPPKPEEFIDEWLVVVPAQDVESVKINKSCETVKDFRSLTKEDLKDAEIIGVEGSRVSLSKMSQSKNSERLPETGERRRSLSKKHTEGKRGSGIRLSKDFRRCSITISSKKSSMQSATNVPLLDVEKRSSKSLGNVSWFVEPSEENVIIRFKNGNIYEGTVDKKMMNGTGKFVWNDGATYEGDFKQGEATGKGVLTYSDLTCYKGDFCKGMLHGEGVLNISSSPMIYSGMWKGGKKHGQGWLLYDEGDWYDGEWFEDERQGKGLRWYKSCEKYKGQWHEGLQKGQGTMIWTNNDFYKGEWSLGVMHGYGEYIWNAFLNKSLTFPVENMYRGTWVDGMRHGAGIMNFGNKSGSRFAGIWEKNCKHGAGVVLCGNGVMIENNPLFLRDKPVHIAFHNSVQTLENIGNDPDNANMEINKQSESNPVDKNKSSLRLIAQQLCTKTSNKDLDPKIIESINRVNKNLKLQKDIEFVKGNPCNPLEIPIHATAEQIDVTLYIEIAVEKYVLNDLLSQLRIFHFEKESQNISDTSEESKYSISKINMYTTASKELSSLKYPSATCRSQTQSNCSKFENLKFVQLCLEEKQIRHAIINYLPKFKTLYNKYASLTTLQHKMDFEPVMIRLFLWQFLRDIGLHKQNYSLAELDTILIDNPVTSLETEHYPFEKIYFWQFLHILITLSWTLYTSNNTEISPNFKINGVLCSIFVEFLDKVVFSSINVNSLTNKPQGCSVFQYIDLLPIRSTYMLYKSFGEPHTARTLLNNICIKKGHKPYCYLKDLTHEKVAKIIHGKNAVSVGENISFSKDEPTEIGIKPCDVPVDDQPTEPFYKQLYIFRHLTPKKIAKFLIAVCPKISDDNSITNMQYPLVFIEFYETLLQCAFHVVDKVKKREEKLKQQEDDRLKEIKEQENEHLLIQQKTAKANKDKKKTKSK